MGSERIRSVWSIAWRWGSRFAQSLVQHYRAAIASTQRLQSFQAITPATNASHCVVTSSRRYVIFISTSSWIFISSCQRFARHQPSEYMRNMGQRCQLEYLVPRSYVSSTVHCSHAITISISVMPLPSPTVITGANTHATIIVITIDHAAVLACHHGGEYARHHCRCIDHQHRSCCCPSPTGTTKEVSTRDLGPATKMIFHLC